MATISLEQQHTAIAAITTATVFSALAGANDSARIKPGMIHMRNKGTADNTVTLIKNDGTAYEVAEFTLAADEEWLNPGDIVIAGNATTLTVTTSSTSALDVTIGNSERAA